MNITKPAKCRSRSDTRNSCRWRRERIILYRERMIKPGAHHKPQLDVLTDLISIYILYNDSVISTKHFISRNYESGVANLFRVECQSCWPIKIFRKSFTLTEIKHFFFFTTEIQFLTYYYIIYITHIFSVPTIGGHRGGGGLAQGSLAP